jgi:hypothetical protein
VSFHKVIKSIAALVIFSLPFSCSEDGSSAQTLEFAFSFESSDNWTVGFSDYPVGEEEFYELASENTFLPDNLGNTIPALLISGNNHSVDLFMYAKKRINGLKPGREYVMTAEIEFSTNASSECFGVGGTPGTSVYIKAGVSVEEPVSVASAEDFYEMNIDKGNQSTGGKNAAAVGHFGNDNQCENVSYVLKTLDNFTAPLEMTSDGNGSVWIFVGIDSGFESTTAIFINSFTITFMEII